MTTSIFVASRKGFVRRVVEVIWDTNVTLGTTSTFVPTCTFQTLTPRVSDQPVVVKIQLWLRWTVKAANTQPYCRPQADSMEHNSLAVS